MEQRKVAKTILTFSVDSKRDKDIIAYFDSLPYGEGSISFRRAIRAYKAGEKITNATIYRKIIEIKKLLIGEIALEELSEDIPISGYEFDNLPLPVLEKSFVFAVR